MANPHQAYAINPASLSNQSTAQQQNAFYPSQGQITNPAMLAAMQQQQARIAAQIKLQHQHQHHQQQHTQQQIPPHLPQQQQQLGLGVNPAALTSSGTMGGFNPTQLQLNSQQPLMHPNSGMGQPTMSLQDRQMAYAKAMAQQQMHNNPSQFPDQQHRPQQHQGHFGFDARMMPPPPPPPNQQRPPSTRPGTAGSLPSNVVPGLQRTPSQSQIQSPATFQSPGQYPPQQQQQQQQQQRFPSVPPYDGTGQSSPHVPSQSQPLQTAAQATPFPQQQPSQQQPFGVPNATSMNSAIAGVQAQHVQFQGQPASPYGQSGIHPQSSYPNSPSARKRKLTAAPSPGPPSTPAQNVSLGVQRSGSDARPPLPTASQGANGTNPVPLNTSFTRVTKVPLAGSGTTIPPLSQEDLENINRWMQSDKDYERAFTSMRERNLLEINRTTRSKIGWWEEPVKGQKPERFALLWPDRKRSDRIKRLKRAGIRWEGLRLPGRLSKDLTDRREDLVPIRLELDIEHHKLRDTFLWNVNDPLVTPEQFAQSIVDDFKLASHYGPTIAKSIHEQLQEHEPQTQEDDKAGEHGYFDESEETWWNAWRKRIRTENGYVRVGSEEDNEDADDEAHATTSGKALLRKRKKKRAGGVVVPEVMDEIPMEIDQLRPKETPVYTEEWRILIKLDILVGTIKLDDQFEWDVACSTNSPEQFAILYAVELGLPGEFTTAIAHQIREQVYAYRKAISSGQVIEDEDLRPSFLPPVTRSTIARSVETANVHTPLLNYMSDGEIERNERERDKELKRKRRTARGRAQATRMIPDRTHRTPGIGFPESDNAALQAAAAANVPTTSRRAAAAAASVTIANMVASENGGSPIQANLPDPILRPKEVPKKPPPPRAPQRLFKAPKVPTVALCPRAKVIAPIPSTSLDPTKYKRSPPKEGDEPLDEEPPPPPPVPIKLTAKQLRDLEKEAKEKEYAEGQHENIIDGVWHCSNCGCPENIAVGRRKGPLGDKSQCGPCGKFYHRHRRPRPVEYHAEESYHLNLKLEAERAKAVNRRKGGAAALRANQEASASPVKNSAVPDQDDGEEEDEKPESKSRPVSVAAGSNNNVPRPPDSRTGAASPADSSSSEEPPLALSRATTTTKLNGSQKPRSVSDPSPPVSSFAPPTVVSPTLSSAPLQQSPKPQSQQPSKNSAPPQVSPQLSPTSVAPGATRIISTAKSIVKVPRPEWLKNALDTMQARYPDDRFDVVLRKTTDPNVPAEWRVKCLDCPGKLYTPGPAETLINFDVHLKNRNHRAKVNARIQGLTSTSPQLSSTPPQ